jgi:membrane fusion protein (multidrug efflux system)
VNIFTSEIKLYGSGSGREFINPINTRVSAYIKEIKFIEHQKVKKGDTLVILDDREILPRLDRLKQLIRMLWLKKQTSSSVNTVSTISM